MNLISYNPSEPHHPVRESATQLLPPQVLELKLKALVLDTIHNMDVLDALEAGGVTSVGDWLWQKQLRYWSDMYTSRSRVINY